MTETRERLLTAANELFRRHGYHDTSLKQVTVAASAPVGSLYHFFPGGKDELASAAIESSGANYQQLFVLIADEAGDIVTAVGEFFEGAAAVLEESDYIDICPIGTVAREVASTNEPLRLATNRVFTAWIAEATRRFVGAGLSDAEAAELAATLIASLEGGFMLARSARDTFPLRSIGRVIQRLVADRVGPV